MTSPIKPSEVVSKKASSLPKEVIEVFNQLIAKHWNGSNSTFKMSEVEHTLCGKLDCIPSYLYDNHYLDVEDIYRAEGWKVYFDKPGYNESYPSTYEFSKD